MKMAWRISGANSDFISFGKDQHVIGNPAGLLYKQADASGFKMRHYYRPSWFLTAVNTMAPILRFMICFPYLVEFPK